MTLKVDNAEWLLDVVHIGAANFDVSEEQLMQELELWMWKEDGKFRDERSGLFDVAAGNTAGVPEMGALGCLEALLRRFPRDSIACSPDQYALVVVRAQGKGREEALSLLHRYHAGELH